MVYAEVVRHLFGLGETRRRRRDPTARPSAVRCPSRRPPCSSASAAAAAAGAASRRPPPPAAVVLLRVGSRGSRLALTQAERAAAALRRPGIEIALVPITTAGDRDRTRPFGEIGSRGVFVKELEEALLEGRIDVAVHSAKDMTSTDVRRPRRRRLHPRARIRATRFAVPPRIRPGMRIGTASVRRRAQLLALEPTLRDRAAARQHRHPPAQARRAGPRCDRPRGLRARAPRPRRRDRPPLRPRGAACPRPGRARSRCRCARARSTSSRSPNDPETMQRVQAERRCVAVVGGGCLAPVAAHHDGVRPDRPRRGRGRHLDRAALGRRRRRPRRRARRSRALRPGGARPRHAAGRARRSRSSPCSPHGGHDVVHRPLIGSTRSATNPSTSQATTGSSSRVSTAPTRSGGVVAGPCRASRRSVRATAAAMGGADLVASVSTQEGLLAELPRPAGRVLFAGAEGARQLIVRSSAPTSSRSTARSSSHPSCRQVDLAVIASAIRSPSVRAARLPARRSSRSARETTRAARAAGLDVRAEAATHDVPGLVAAVDAAAGTP